MSVILYYHPRSRAANVVWMLEEVGVPYERRLVDFASGEHKQHALLALNPMGKLPVLTDGDAVITESAAIALYLADRYAPGRLAPALDDAKRGTYLRWSFFSPSVIEPGLMAKAAGWTYRDSQAGWGTYQSMLAAMQHAIADRKFLLGDEFSMADVVFGGTMGYMLQSGMLERLPVFTAYVERLGERPALQRANAINAEERARLSPAK
jgi:glutathione S-transferase